MRLFIGRIIEEGEPMKEKILSDLLLLLPGMARKPDWQ
jgi:hypothetical protein